MRRVGVLDRTGTLLPLLDRWQEADGRCEVVDLGRPADLGPATERVDVLVLGPREVTAAGARRLGRWSAAFPASSTVAYLPVDGGAAAPEVDLRAAGVDVLVRRVPTTRNVAAALDKALGVVDLLAAQAGSPDDAEPGEADPAPDEDAAAEHAGLLDDPDSSDEPAGDVEEDAADDDGAPAEEPDGPATVLTVASATGGCGKTFFATNLAALIAATGSRVLLVDLDLQFGEVAAALRVRHPYSVYDGLYDAKGRPLPDTSLQEHLHQLVAHHGLGFDVLTAPREPALADYVGAADAAHVLDVVTEHYDVVIVDTPPSLNEVVLTALERSDLVVVMATLDVPSLKNLTVFLDTLRRLRLDDSVLRLVMNKVEPDVGIDMKQAQEAFDSRFVAGIPQSRAVSRSINAGTAVVSLEPRDVVSRSLVVTAAAVLPSHLAERLPPPVEPGRLLTRLRAWWRGRTTASGGTA